jgi:hypothetical protein
VLFFLSALLLTVIGLLCAGSLFLSVILLLNVCSFTLCVCAAVLHNLFAGLLARSQYLEGPATGHLGTGFSWFPLCLQANAETVPKAPSCYCMLLM